MANPGQLQITGQYSFGGVTTPVSSGTATIANVVGSVIAITLASGANAISIPTGASYVRIQLPDGNAVNITLKGVTGDTGFPLGATGFLLLPILSGATTFTLTAASNTSSPTYIYFY